MSVFNRTRIALCLAAALSPLAASAADLPDARSLMDRYVEVIGGKKAYEAFAAVNTMKMTMDFVENGMRADIVNYSSGQDRATVMSIAGVGEFRSGYAGGVAWAMDPMNGPRLLEGKEREQAIEMSDNKIALRDASAIASAKTTVLSESEGRPCYRVEIKWVSGRETADCYGTEDGLLLSNETTVNSPMGDMKQISHMLDYKTYGGVRMATKMKGSAAGMNQVFTLQSVEPTAPPADTFALPTAIQALVKKGTGDTRTEQSQ
jgi:hypothetical protein